MTTMIARIHSTGVELGQWLRFLVHGRSRSTTRRTLLALMAGLMIVTVAVFITSLLAFTRGYGTADTVHNHTAPAILGIVTARDALVHADRAAIDSVTTGAHLSGPGEEFQNQIAIASQSLTRVAEDNMAGEVGSRDLQLIDGLLVTYTGLVGQADAHFRQPGGEPLGTADLWSASRLLHNLNGGILAQLDTLLAAQQDALDAQLSTSSMTPGAVLLLLLPVVGLVALLVITSIFLWRRFRRRVNACLVLAVVPLGFLVWILIRVVVSQQHLEDSRHTLDRLMIDWQTQISVTDAEGQKALRDQVGIACGSPGECGATVARFVTDVEGLDNVTGGVTASQLTGEIQRVNEQTAAATAGASLQPLIYILAVLIAAAVLLGFRPRLNEYRYRPK